LASVEKSILLVASSSTIIELLLNKARAIAISCRCPWEKLVPPGETFVSKLIFALGSISVFDVAIEIASEGPCVELLTSRSTLMMDAARE
jgi:hypothetical protein